MLSTYSSITLSGSSSILTTPLLQIAVYALVFQVILKSNIENYAVYLCCGLIPWQYFSNIVIRGAAVMVDNGNIIKKVWNWKQNVQW